MNDINTFLIEMRNQFIADLPERLDTMESLVLVLEQSDGCDATFNEVYRAVHNLKGSAGTHGLHILSTIAHHFENELTHIGIQYKNNIPSRTDVLLQNIDLLRHALEQIKHNQTDFSDIETRLKQQYLVNGTEYSRVLLLESSQVVNKMIRQTLSAYPIQLETCDDGYTALQRLLLEPFDIVITNIEVPLLNGVALIAALRLSDPGRNITSILVTASPHKSLHHDIDPDYTILKDESFLDRLAAIIGTITSTTRT